jgi:hypothetical protein
MAENKPFTSGDQGQDTGSLRAGLLVPGGGPLLVGDKPMPDNFIPSISRIEVTTEGAPLYTCTIEVTGACPKGKFNNRMEFTDESNDAYTLRIFSSSHKVHTVHYNSSAPNINAITWDI